VEHVEPKHDVKSKFPMLSDVCVQSAILFTTAVDTVFRLAIAILTPICPTFKSPWAFEYLRFIQFIVAPLAVRHLFSAFP